MLNRDLMEHKKKDENVGKSSQSKISYRVVFGSSAIAGFAEAFVFQPTDTIVARLQKSEGKKNPLMQTIFARAYNKNILNKVSSLYDGGSWAILQKVLQRGYKFGSQPIVVSQLNNWVGEQYKRMFGDKGGKIMLEATAGSILSVGEVFFLPFDNLKTKFQTQKEYCEQLGVYNIVKSEGLNLYNGTIVSLIRNSLASLVLFGASSSIKEYIFNLNDHKDATLSQNFAAAAAGASAAVVTTNFADVIKTRVQSRMGSVSALSIFKDTLNKEGASALFKGVTVRLLTVAPKLTFSMTVAQSLPNLWRRLTDKTGTQAAVEADSSSAPKLKRP